MTTVSDIENHPLIQRLRRYRNAIEALPKDSVERIRRKSRLLGLFDYIDSNIRKSDAVFVPDELFNLIQTKLDEMNTHLSNFTNEMQDVELDHAISSLSAAVRLIPAPYTARFANLNKSHLDRFGERVDELIERFEQRVEAIEANTKNAEALAATTEEQLNELSESAAVFNEGLTNTFQESQAQRRDEFKTEIQSINDQAAKALKVNSESLQSKIQELDLARKNFIEDSGSELKAANDRHKSLLEDYAKKKSDFVAKIDEDIREIVEKRNHIRELYHLTGNDATVGGYQSQADQEKKSADLYRIVAITLMVIAAGALLYPYIMEIIRNQRHDLQWAVFLERLPLSTIILVPALYAARESGKHRSEERHLRTLQLQISTLDPYLSTLPDSKKKQIKEDLVGKYFDGRRAEKTSRYERSMFDKILDELRKIGGNFTSGPRGGGD